MDNLLSDDYSLREVEGEKIDAILEENGLARPTYDDPTTYIKLNDTYQLTGFDYSYLHIPEEEYDTAMKHIFYVGLVPPEEIDIKLYSTEIGKKLEVDPSTIEVEEGSLKTDPKGFTFDVVCTDTQQRANVSVSTRGIFVSRYASTPTVEYNFMSISSGGTRPT